tara:strand:- start:184 stop:552 length:369 start_codon:yes stop_codon:yes gene_type:complete
MPFCRECGKEVEVNWNTCPFCSANISESRMKSNKQSSNDGPVTKAQLNRILVDSFIIIVTFSYLFLYSGYNDLTIFEAATLECGTTFENSWCYELKDEAMLEMLLVILLGILALITGRPKDK